MSGRTTILTLALVLAVFPDGFAQSLNAQKSDISQETNKAALSLDDVVQRKDYPQLEVLSIGV
jgi:hypothetical protein